MTGFDSAWLELRAPADDAARSSLLVCELAQLLAARPPGRCVDLATGTGANVRALAPSLGSDQRWLVLDHDRALLESLPRQMIEWAERRRGTGTARPHGVDVELPAVRIQIEVAYHDLAQGLAGIELDGCALVAGSALLDLVSRRWLSELIECSAIARAPVHLALSYDGRVDLQPAVGDDAWIVAALNRHQQRDKGFGTALGPMAAAMAIRLFERAGFRVRSVRSDWQLQSDQAALQSALFEGWARAATELEPMQAERTERWITQRRSLIHAGCSTARIGHIDLLAWRDPD